MKEQQQLNPEPIEKIEKTNEVEEPREMDRRQALAALGKFALFTAPVMTTLLTSKKAAALSPSSAPPSHPPWSPT